MSEKAIMRTLREKTCARWPDTHWQRLEDKLSIGIPDASVAIPGLGEWWVEGKHVACLPAKPGTPIKLGIRPGQRLWLVHRHRLGCRVMVFAKVDKYCLTFRHSFNELYNGVTWEVMLAMSDWMSDSLYLDSIWRP